MAEKEEAFVTKSNFKFQQLLMKSDFAWRVRVLLDEILPETFRKYTLSFVLNEKPWLDEIASIENKIKEMQADTTLFPKDQKREITTMKARIKELNEEIKKAREEANEITVDAQIEKLEYSYKGTDLTFIVAFEVAEWINEKQKVLGHYQIELRTV